MNLTIDPFHRVFADKASAMTDAANLIYASPDDWEMDLALPGETITVIGTCNLDDAGEDRVLRTSWYPNRDGFYKRHMTLELWINYRRVTIWLVSDKVSYRSLFELPLAELVHSLNQYPTMGRLVTGPVDDDAE